MQGHDPDAASFLMKPEDPQLSLMRLIGQNAIVTPRQVRRTSPPRSDATCFHTLLAGSGHLQVGTLLCDEPPRAPHLHASASGATPSLERCNRKDSTVLSMCAAFRRLRLRVWASLGENWSHWRERDLGAGD